MSVLRHGELVRDFYDDLIAHLETGSPLKGEWKLPDWVADPRVLEKQLDRETVREYARLHDCGKPSVRTVDEDGRQHFPGHAAASERIWLEIGGDPQIGRLIGMDMDIHTIKDADVAEFASRPEAATLMLIGLSEIHANASMFGGVDSVSFKMKWKQIDKRGRAILKQW
ncbi:HD domain-containing protein [Rhizobium sp. MHM7A]|uniref:HD domain-containing protein n=1 Tax=Rhizobium sp. MHM7A TaxID=2583233 RepID=UPI0019816A7F|nr:HD domain-containing protein [Rhizobium sp. MHM7A]